MKMKNQLLENKKSKHILVLKCKCFLNVEPFTCLVAAVNILLRQMQKMQHRVKSYIVLVYLFGMLLYSIIMSLSVMFYVRSTKSFSGTHDE